MNRYSMEVSFLLFRLRLRLRLLLLLLATHVEPSYGVPLAPDRLREEPLPYGSPAPTE